MERRLEHDRFKGDLYTKLLSEKDQFTFFFLERGNWLIFQDVYPQFLLYEQSVKKQKSFHLLPHLNVSTFMETMWNFLENWKQTNINDCDYY